MDEVIYLSPEKRQELERELELLSNTKRREIAAKINEAKDQGDLSENAEYIQAREEQGFVEGRIVEIEDVLKRATVVKAPADHVTISVGSRISVSVNDQKRDLELVGSQEANPSSGKISNESPLGSALMGRHVGDTVKVMVPKGEMIYQILAIK